MSLQFSLTTSMYKQNILHLQRIILISIIKAELDTVRNSNDFSNYCGKFNSQKSYLIVHYRTHTGVKGFQRITCPKTFSPANSLKTHEKISTGTKNYKYSMWLKTFSHACTLKTHEVAHNGVRDFKCIKQTNKLSNRCIEKQRD